MADKCQRWQVVHLTVVDDSFYNVPLIIQLLFLIIVSAALHRLCGRTTSRTENVIRFEKEKVRVSEQEAVTGGRL